MNWIFERTSDIAHGRATSKDGQYIYCGAFNPDTCQPNGLGAHYSKDGKYIEGGYWEEGLLENALTEEEYNTEQNQQYLSSITTRNKW